MSLEVLAPAGSRESLMAAVRCGTDAVYLGASAFNARRNADNFDALSLSDAVRYCHGRNVRVYVTLNTLIFNNEIPSFVKCLEEVLDAGPDCLIIQDLGVFDIIRSVCPDIPLCGSTQMAICNADGAKALEDLGIRQVVLARELSLDEIARIHSETSLKLETFIHGAHCMSVSGLCYFSAALGERSGNRGLCAQPCRMDFRCKGREYALSLKDLSFVTHIKELEEAGVSSLKIEGRMKRPEYVAAAVTEVRKAIKGENPNMEDLKKVFSRSGFTDGYITGKRNASMFGVRSTEDISASKETLGRMASLYRLELSKIPVRMSLSMDAEKTVLTVSDTNRTATEECVTVSADTGVLTAEMAERALKKTGNTPFIAQNIDVRISESLKVPSSFVNGIKKSALSSLLEANSVGISYKRKPFIPRELPKKSAVSQGLHARFANIEQIVFTDKFSLIILPIEEIYAHQEILQTIPNLCAELPTVIWQGAETKFKEKLADLYRLGLRDVSVGNISAIQYTRGIGFRVHGDYTLNITNTYAAEQYAGMGLVDAVLSSELTSRQAEQIDSSIRTGYYVYGKLPLMFFRSCPARTEKGCEKCPGRSEITDKFKHSFPVLCHGKQYSVMHNCVPLYLLDAERPCVDFLKLYFSTETKQEVKDIIYAFEKHLKFTGPFTRGHSVNGVR